MDENQRGRRSYTNEAGLISRANSALSRIEMIQNRKNLPSEVRLALIAEVMQGEPILFDTSPAAYRTRRLAREFGEYE